MPAAAPAYTAADLPEKLKWYYARLFPLQSVVKWLRYGSNENLSRREISFTLPGDIYVRWKSFPNGDAFLEALKNLKPIKIDIGAIYNFPPADKNSVGGVLIPQQKELVFDIDLTDYEDVMGDLAGGNPTEMTDRNWRFMSTAVKVLDTALREDFGYEHILWVYSGRRGIHCWVGDARARRLSNEQRSAVADYLHVRFEGRENIGRRQNEVTNPMHPSLLRAKRVACDATFREFSIGEHGLLDSSERAHTMAKHIPVPTLAGDVYDKLERLGNGRGMEKWERLERELGRAARNEYGARAVTDYIILRHTYPRLDVNVSREINHLLKAPFCVHPGSGRVCIPFRAGDVESFQPDMAAPRLDELFAELDDGGGPACQRLAKAVEVLDDFVRGLEQESRADSRTKRLQEMDARGALDTAAAR